MVGGGYEQVFGALPVSGQPREAGDAVATSEWDEVATAPGDGFSVAGLFAGIGGLELGLHAAGGETRLLCEYWEPAAAVLEARFPGVPLAPDVRTIERLPDVDVVTAGFPCTDLSQAGRTSGIRGEQSGLVEHLFRLLRSSSPSWVVVENVRNMLVLDQGTAMRYLVDQFEALGYAWAYRLVDSRFTGVPQRRQRVIFVASKERDPRHVLFADDDGERAEDDYRDDAHGFYWTEGLRGLGWARDALPTLKGGSTLGIPSPPAVWIRDAEPGQSVVTPHISHAERLQGFPTGWTAPAETVTRTGTRWKLVGNAVTVDVAGWIGRRLNAPARATAGLGREIDAPARWPLAGAGARGRRFTIPVSMWPTATPYRHLMDVLTGAPLKPLSLRAVSGFLSRTERSSLRFDDQFLVALKEHEQVMTGADAG